MLKTFSITVTGKVQGVYFRQSTREMATALGIKGQVRNMPGETVNIIATGNSNEMEKFIEWCRQGPSRAKVANVIVKEIPLESFEKFSIVR